MTTRNAVLAALRTGVVRRKTLHQCACRYLGMRCRFDPKSRWLDMHVSGLRRQGYDIETVRGVGYRLVN